MEVPSKVRIGSIDYDVIIEDKTIVLDAVQCKGQIDYDYHKINIDSSVQDKQGQEQTFLHELLHGIVRDRNVQVENEELVVEEIARGLHQVIKDNSEMFIGKSIVSYDPYVVKTNNEINISELAEEVAKKLSQSLNSLR